MWVLHAGAWCGVGLLAGGISGLVDLFGGIFLLGGFVVGFFGKPGCCWFDVF